MTRVRRRSLPGIATLIAATAILTLAAPAGVHPARADTAIVQQDATPIVSRPGVGGRILTRVDTGFTLTVLGREGEWLEVASPQLKLTGELWVPAARVGDIVAAPADLTPSEPASATTAAPQFRITSNMSGSMSALPLGTTTTAGPRNSGGVSSAVTRSTSATVMRSTSVNAAGSATTQAKVSATTAAGDVTPPSDNPTPAPGNPTPTVDSSPTPALGNPTPAVSGNSTPALGNPTPAVSGNSTPAPGNPTPAMGNAVSGFSGSSVTSP
jgi:hypothetical protein